MVQVCLIHEVLVTSSARDLFRGFFDARQRRLQKPRSQSAGEAFSQVVGGVMGLFQPLPKLAQFAEGGAVAALFVQ